jgi:hypothetical protein
MTTYMPVSLSAQFDISNTFKYVALNGVSWSEPFKKIYQSILLHWMNLKWLFCFCFCKNTGKNVINRYVHLTTLKAHYVSEILIFPSNMSFKDSLRAC